MTTLEAIQLVKSVPPEEASAEDLAALRKLLKEVPSLFAALGGPEVIADYLASADTALAEKASGRPTIAARRCPPSYVAREDQEVETPRSPAAVRRTWLQMFVHYVLHPAVLFALIAGLLVWGGWLLSRDTGRSASNTTSGIAGTGVELQTSRSPGQAQHSTPLATDNRGESVKPVVVQLPPPKSQVATIAAVEPTEQPAAPLAPPDQWGAWLITAEKGAVVEWQPAWNLSNPVEPRPVKQLVSGGGRVTLSAKLKAPINARSVIIYCERLAPTAPGEFELRVDGKSIGRGEVPSAGGICPIPIIRDDVGGREVSVEVVYVPRDPSERIRWDKIEFSTKSYEVLTFTEPDVNLAGLALWLAADRGVQDAAGWRPQDKQFDGRVQTWEDQSPRHLHVTCAGDPAGRPAFVRQHGGFGGRPVLRFDGGNTLRHQGNVLYEGPGGSTTFAVFEMTATSHGTQRSQFMTVLETSAPRFFLGTESRWRNVLRYWVRASAPEDITAWVPDKNGQVVIAVMLNNGKESFLRINGQGPGGNHTGVRSGDSFTVGPQGSHLAELLVFNRPLPEAEIRKVACYLQGKYAVAAQY